MKRCALFAFLYLLAAAIPVFSQGSLLPDIPPTFLNASGLVASGAKLCTTATGGNTSLATYSDSALTSALLNPITLNALGIPQTSGGVSTAIYIQPREYRITLYAAGTGNTCNGVAVGAQIWQRDHVFDLANLPEFDNVQLCSRFPGANAGAKIQTCINALPSAGGTADARGLEGAQAITAGITFGKPVRLILGATTYSSTVTTGAAFVMSADSEIECHATTIHTTVNGANADGIYGSARAKIHGCTLTGNTTFSTGASAIEGGGDDMQIYENDISLWGGHAINTGLGVNRWSMHNNRIHESHDDAILLAGTGHKIYTNDFYRSGSNSVDINGSGNHVFDNDIDQSGFVYGGTGVDCDGILISSVQGNANENDIHDNRITLTQCAGIRVRADTAVTTANRNKLRGNTIAGGVNAYSPGILVDGSVGATCGRVDFTEISGNTLSQNGAQGVLVGGGAGTPCQINGTAITTNIMTGNVGIGIQVAYGTAATLAFNSSTSNTGGQLSTAGSTLARDICNFVDMTTNKCTYGGTTILELDTMQPRSSSFVTVTSTGNTQFTVNSTGVGRRPYSLLLDGAGALNFYDDTSTAIRMSIASAGGVNVASSLSVGTAGGAISKTLTGFATLDFPNTTTQLSADLTITVTGAVDQDTCMVGVPGASQNANSEYSCFVSAADTVTVRFANFSAGAINPASAQFKVFLVHF